MVKIFNGVSDSSDIACSLETDNDKNIYVSGTSYNGSFGDDFVLIKYDSTGQVVWVKYIDFGNYEHANFMCMDDLNNIYITGYSLGSYATVKCTSDGQQLWSRTYNGVEFGN